MIDKSSNVSRVSSIGGSTPREERRGALLFSSAIKQTSQRLGLTLALMAFGVQGFAQSTNNAPFVSFSDFMSHTRQVSAHEFVGQADVKLDTLMTTRNAAAPRTTFKVKNEQSFEEMRKAILFRYQGIEVTHSFVQDNQHYDCVPIKQQPAMRKYHLTEIATPPVLPVASGQQAELETKAEASLVPERQFDDYGNLTRCETNTVALPRLTLETLSRFPSLHDFYKKPGRPTKRNNTQEGIVSPSKLGVEPEQAATDDLGHKYVVFGQDVTNLGGNVTFNIWSPFVDTSKGQVFSLMQMWVIGDHSSEETGWVVYPEMFGDENSHFFIFSTADDYQTTGSWNNAANDFVQVADFGVLGSSFGGYSSPGGAQHEFSVAYYRDASNNWWLFRGGVAVGYYPAAFYGSDPTTRHTIEVGTETAPGTVASWPGAGSGQWATALYGYAAYVRQLQYYSTSNVAIWNDYDLFGNSNCYNWAGPFQNGQGGNILKNDPNPSWWTRYLFLGGPGGTTCN
jgi:Neprosin